MLDTPMDIKRAIKRLRDFYDPVTGSIILLSLSAGRDDYLRDPFRKGFLDTVDERKELIRRLGRLEERKRRLLLLWHLEANTKDDIARKLSLSRMHVYRLHGQAIDELVKMAQEESETTEATAETAAGAAAQDPTVQE